MRMQHCNSIVRWQWQRDSIRPEYQGFRDMSALKDQCDVKRQHHDAQFQRMTSTDYAEFQRVKTFWEKMTLVPVPMRIRLWVAKIKKRDNVQVQTLSLRVAWVCTRVHERSRKRRKHTSSVRTRERAVRSTYNLITTKQCCCARGDVTGKYWSKQWHQCEIKKMYATLQCEVRDEKILFLLALFLRILTFDRFANEFAQFISTWMHTYVLLTSDCFTNQIQNIQSCQ